MLPERPDGTRLLYASGSAANSGPTNVTMSRDGGGAFDLFSLDAAENTGGGADTLTVTGTLLAGGTVVQTLGIGNSF